jgi:hypothetical protein
MLYYVIFPSPNPQLGMKWKGVGWGIGEINGIRVQILGKLHFVLSQSGPFLLSLRVKC